MNFIQIAIDIIVVSYVAKDCFVFFKNKHLNKKKGAAAILQQPTTTKSGKVPDHMRFS